MIRAQGFFARRAAVAAARGARPSTATPLALLRMAAIATPRRIAAVLANGVLRSLGRNHPRLLGNLAALDPAVVHVMPTDLPYGFALHVGRTPPALSVVAREATGSDATIRASIAVLTELLEGRVDGDTLFFRRDLQISGNTAVIVGLRNVLDRETIKLADELAAALGPLARPSRALARVAERVTERLGARVAAVHRALHPREDAPEAAGGIELERCRADVAALSARLGRLEARQMRRDEKSA